MATRVRLLEKVLRYHLPLAVVDPEAAMQSVAAHWRGFTWRCGPVMVRWSMEGWPELQVWAESASEGVRVVSHALAHIGLNASDGEWNIATVENKRNGKIGTVSATMVSARTGPKGAVPHLPILP